MEIILLKKVKNIGKEGEIVTVKNGYARNFLIPKNMAILATDEAKSKVESQHKKLKEHEDQRLVSAQSKEIRSEKAVLITRLCGEEGQLYGSVSEIDISEALSNNGILIDKSEVCLPDGLIKHVGEYQAEIILHPKVQFTVKVTVKGNNRGPLS